MHRARANRRARPERVDRETEKRLRGYWAIGYEHATLPAGYDGPTNEPVIEPDEPELPGYEDP